VVFTDLAGWEEFTNVGSRLAWVAAPLRWMLASRAERRWVVHSMHAEVRESWGLPASALSVESLEPDVMGYFDPDTDHLAIASHLLERDDIESVIGTIVHENRHALQSAILDGEIIHPLGPLGVEEVEVWRAAEEDYDQDDFVSGYMYNPLETDARSAEAGALIGYWKAAYRGAVRA
jgi:hypothetical protein